MKPPTKPADPTSSVSDAERQGPTPRSNFDDAEDLGKQMQELDQRATAIKLKMEGFCRKMHDREGEGESSPQTLNTKNT